MKVYAYKEIGSIEKVEIADTNTIFIDVPGAQYEIHDSQHRIMDDSGLQLYALNGSPLKIQPVACNTIIIGAE